jgi:hypothetical protein
MGLRDKAQAAAAKDRSYQQWAREKARYEREWVRDAQETVRRVLRIRTRASDWTIRKDDRGGGFELPTAQIDGLTVRVSGHGRYTEVSVNGFGVKNLADLGRVVGYLSKLDT